jgi:hypothetical protein
MSSKIQEAVLYFLIVAGLTLLATVVGLGLWALFSVSVGALRIWAALATLASIGALFLGYWLGLKEAHARVKGIEQGIERVSKAVVDTLSAANQVAQVKIDIAKKAKAESQPQIQQVFLPGIPFTPGLIGPARREKDEIELE